MTATAERPIANGLRATPGNWRNQVDTLLIPVERELVAKIRELEQQADATRDELRQLRNVKREAGVISEVTG